MSKLLATDFGVWPIPAGQNLPTEKILSTSDYWERIADYLLLYDQIIIPTGNLQIIYVLRNMFGDDIFEALIRNNVITFVRFDHWYAYLSTGNIAYIQHTPNTPGSQFKLSHFDPLDQTIEIALLLPTNKPSTKERRLVLKNLLLDKIIELPSINILETAKKEAFDDFRDSSLLRKFYSLNRNPIRNDDFLAKDVTSLNIFNPYNYSNQRPPTNIKSREISAVLNVMFENFLLNIGDFTGASAITGDNYSICALNAKGQRFGFATEGRKAFTQIQKQNNIPAVGSDFASKRLSAANIFEFRNSDEAAAFRRWLSEGSIVEKEEEILGRYTESLNKKHPIDKWPPLKTIKFVVITGLGLWDITAGIAAGIVDNFFLGKWIRGKPPNLFIQKAKMLRVNNPIIPAPIIKSGKRKGL